MVDRTLEPTLRDVVPWNYGFGHTWALSALLQIESQRGSSALLDRMTRVHGSKFNDCIREGRFGGRRADLKIEAEGEGRKLHVALETKVRDTYVLAQVDDYKNAEATSVVLYLPSFTGMLVSEEIEAEHDGGVVVLCAKDVLELCEPLRGSVGTILDGYLDDLECERKRQEIARANAWSGDAKALPEGFAGNSELLGEEDSRLREFAYLAETVGLLRGESREIAADPKYRVAAHDTGYFLKGSLQSCARGGCLFAELVRSNAGGCRLLIKAGNGDDGTGLVQASKAARERAADFPHPGWKPARNRSARDAVTVCGLVLDEMRPEEAVEQVRVACEFIRSCCQAEPSSA